MAFIFHFAKPVTGHPGVGFDAVNKALRITAQFQWLANHVISLLAGHTGVGRVDVDDDKVGVIDDHRIGYVLHTAGEQIKSVFGFLKLIDVFDGACHSGWLIVFVRFDHFAPVEHPNPAVVTGFYSIRGFKMFVNAVKMLLQQVGDPVQILGMDGFPIGRKVTILVGGQAAVAMAVTRQENLY